MRKTEVKKLLKRRDELLHTHEELNYSCYDVDNTTLVDSIYKNSRNEISNILHNIDIELLNYVKEFVVGRWLLQIKGITPDLAAGLLAYFDVKDKDCAAQFIRFAGIDDSTKPYNNNIGKIMSDVKNNLIRQDGLYKKLALNKFIDLTKNDGLDVHVAINRSNRYMLKIFIGHLFEEMYREEHDGELPIRYNDFDKIIIEPEVPYTK